VPVAASGGTGSSWRENIGDQGVATSHETHNLVLSQVRRITWLNARIGCLLSECLAIKICSGEPCHERGGMMAHVFHNMKFVGNPESIQVLVKSAAQIEREIL
jgi:hypothetical protein